MSDTKYLLELIKLHPILYDVSNKEYKDVAKKNQVWKEIGSEIGQEGEVVKRKWKNMKDSYAKYIKSRTDSNHDASTSLAYRYKNWPWAEQMEVFKPFLSFISKISDARECGLETETNVSYTSQLPANANSEKQSHLKRKKKTIAASISSEDKGIHYSPNKCSHNNLDGTELIFLGYAKTVKTFSPKRQAVVKMKIAQLLMEQEIEQQCEQPSWDNIPS